MSVWSNHFFGTHNLPSSGQTEVKFDSDGHFGLSHPDGCGLLFGKGIGFGQEVGIIDMPILMKMQDMFHTQHFLQAYNN